MYIIKKIFSGVILLKVIPPAFFDKSTIELYYLCIFLMLAKF